MNLLECSELDFKTFTELVTSETSDIKNKFSHFPKYCN